VPASSKTELATVVAGYALCARAEGKSPKTIDALRRSATYLEAAKRERRKRIKSG
jgi:hypothetical protein